jgi:hypothetical protein
LKSEQPGIADPQWSYCLVVFGRKENENSVSRHNSNFPTVKCLELWEIAQAFPFQMQFAFLFYPTP